MEHKEIGEEHWERQKSKSIILPKGDKEGLLASKWTDPKLAKYQTLMSCGYKHYDENIIEILKAQKLLGDINKEKEIKRILDASEGTVQKIFDEMDKLKAQHQKEIEGIIV